MLTAAKTVGRTKKYGSRFQEELWKSQGQTAGDILKLLKLDEHGSRVFESPDLGSWVSYCSKLDKSADDSTAIVFLKAKFKDTELAMTISAAKIQASKDNSTNKMSYSGCNSSSGFLTSCPPTK
ncbi:unnamed protein product [Phytophthora fragariaefolia]|uniref:Unnamed protein product n=1 Tax=Phytophthora fragariaefolia TaxID=1490495 RepID=A0A9W6YAT3_9STRA|nr:unnamed protein product [Phytophthora fragariaefolia]